MAFMIGGLFITLFAMGCEAAHFDPEGIRFLPREQLAPRPRVVDSAIEIRDESELGTLENAGGAYLGDLEVIADKPYTAQKVGPLESETLLQGRVSLDVARRGGTHFHPSAWATGESDRPGKHSFQQIRIRYAVYSVAPDAWSKLDPKYRPEHASGAAVAR